jgi:hypothetical protein
VKFIISDKQVRAIALRLESNESPTVDTPVNLNPRQTGRILKKVMEGSSEQLIHQTVAQRDCFFRWLTYLRQNVITVTDRSILSNEISTAIKLRPTEVADQLRNSRVQKPTSCPRSDMICQRTRQLVCNLRRQIVFVLKLRPTEVAN